jgi:hypothetical protein
MREANTTEFLTAKNTERAKGKCLAFLLFAFFAFFAVKCPAQTQVNLGVYATNFAGLPAAQARMTLTPYAPFAPWTNGFLVPTPIFGVADNTGSYVFSNVYASYSYTLEIDPLFPPAFTTNIGIPAGLTGLINAAAYQGTWLPGMQIFAYTSTNYLLPTNYVVQGGSFAGTFYDTAGTNATLAELLALSNNIPAGNISGTISTNNLPGLLPGLANSNGIGLTNLNATSLVGNVQTNNLTNAVFAMLSAGTNIVFTTNGDTIKINASMSGGSYTSIYFTNLFSSGIMLWSNAHGLGAIPSSVGLELFCATNDANSGYNSNAVILANWLDNPGGNGNYVPGFGVYADATYIYVTVPEDYTISPDDITLTMRTGGYSTSGPSNIKHFKLVSYAIK